MSVTLHLPSEVKTLRTVGANKMVHDGPFAETREQLGGFYLIEASDLDAAIEIAKGVPLAGNGAIESRPPSGCKLIRAPLENAARAAGGRVGGAALPHQSGRPPL